jgi:hypothetical protein
LSGDGGTMDGLRSELSAIVERSRMGDRKQHELEQMVTRLEDEISRYSKQNIQLEERLADKMSHIASLEGKLGQRNLRIVDIQKNLEEKVSEVNGLLREVSLLAVLLFFNSISFSFLFPFSFSLFFFSFLLFKYRWQSKFGKTHSSFFVFLFKILVNIRVFISYLPVLTFRKSKEF